ncbi:hypothetical protein GCM10023169_36660 [Georgenia halophila]|uniref:Uncharacterized protein n=1 Tax=Georgenia halophila TaxID=620889 RepID=A0ABP8LL74_9MICO
MLTSTIAPTIRAPLGACTSSPVARARCGFGTPYAARVEDELWIGCREGSMGRTSTAMERATAQ